MHVLTTTVLPPLLSPKMTSLQDVYAKILTHTEPKRGYPLWSPKPLYELSSEDWKPDLRIGDVGVVDADGNFNTFFNICRPANHPINLRYGVPNGFIQVVLLTEDIRRLVPIDHCGRVVAAQSINQRHLTSGVSVTASSSVYFSTITTLCSRLQTSASPGMCRL